MKVSKIAASRSPSKLYLKPGQTIKVENAILALVTKSANDVATVVCRTFRRQRTQFCKKNDPQGTGPWHDAHNLQKCLWPAKSGAT